MNQRSCLVVSLLSLAMFLSACGEQAQLTSVESAETPIAPPVGQLGFAVTPTHYALDLEIEPSQARFTGIVAIDVTLQTAADSIWLHGENLNVTAVKVTPDGAEPQTGSYAQWHDSGVALLKFPTRVPAGNATLQLTFDAPFNTSAFALFKTVRGDDAYVASQLEALGARQIFPSFDEPAFKVPFDVTITANADNVAITNTPEIEQVALPDGRIKHSFATTRPLPTYLLAFAVGPYDVNTAESLPPTALRDRAVPLRAFAAKGLGPRLTYALDHTEAVLNTLEEYFGMPYPYRKLDLIAMPVSFGGAMENPGAITYDAYLLIMDEDSMLSQRRGYMSVHAHELAHMWFGDLVTPVWWNDIWLNEAFATWMSYKAADLTWPEAEFSRETLKGALAAMANDSLESARQIREPVTHNDDIANAFDGITYEKGGGVLAMLERYTGEAEFQAGIRLHMQRYADKTATADDFITSVAEGSGTPEIAAAFNSFIGQPGIPLLRTSLSCRADGQPSITIEQSRYAPLGSAIDPASGKWQVPACVRYATGEGSSTQCTLLEKAKTSFALETTGCPSFIHPNADGAGYYRFALDDNGWSALIERSAQLNAAEALVLVDSLDAAFRANVVSASTYVSGMTALIAHPAWDVADTVTRYLEQLNSIAEGPQLKALESAMGRFAKPRFDQLGALGSAGDQLLYQRLQRFMIVIARDQQMRAPLADMAVRFIGLENPPEPAALPEDQMETALSVAVQDQGVAFFDRLLERALASEDPAFRSTALGALARAEDPLLVKKLQAAMLGDSRVKGTEFTNILFRQMIRTKTTDLTYQWLKANDTVILAKLPEAFRPTLVPALGGAFCSKAQATEWSAFVNSHKAELPGYERSLAQVTESINLCAALRLARGDELVAAFLKNGQ
jgi:alanyl aminopeptidase